MDKFFDFIQDIFMMKKDDGMKVGLSQFKQEELPAPRVKEVSIRNKDVKLSDLMRRAS